MEVCSICGEDEYLTVVKALDDEGQPVTVRTCANLKHGQPIVTIKLDRVAMAHLSADTAPLVHKLGLYDKLATVVSSLQQPVEYGVVEHCFAYAHTDDYRVLCRKFGHIAVDGPLQYTASAYLGRMLGNLDRHGMVRYIPSAGTGRWAYDSDISAWAPPGVDGPVLSWSMFARENGIDPQDWPAASLVNDPTDGEAVAH